MPIISFKGQRSKSQSINIQQVSKTWCIDGVNVDLRRARECVSRYVRLTVYEDLSAHGMATSLFVFYQYLVHVF